MDAGGVATAATCEEDQAAYQGDRPHQQRTHLRAASGDPATAGTGAHVVPAVGGRHHTGSVTGGIGHGAVHQILGETAHRSASSRPARDARARCRWVLTDPSDIPRVVAVSAVEQSR